VYCDQAIRGRAWLTDRLLQNGRCGCLRWVKQLGAGLAAAAVNVVFFWKLAWMSFLTIRGTFLEIGSDAIFHPMT